ncbi:hypothetical protein A2296_05190 [candidate division CPR3 bacterium RIFOXYB2_FULL_35_8]|nr:MAG: hypothetical protein A2296_05190 [candidate division CPR3 bacterium RIFOXYB2_FULL_35_8]
MSKKNLIISTLALTIGVALGGFVFQTVRADDTEISTTDCPMYANLTQEERDQIRANGETMRNLRDNIERTVTKTDDGIQINLNGEDQETIDQMHEFYDENGGNWGRGGMGKGMRRGLTLSETESN